MIACASVLAPQLAPNTVATVHQLCCSGYARGTVVANRACPQSGCALGQAFRSLDFYAVFGSVSHQIFMVCGRTYWQGKYLFIYCSY
jgi:hypothetical protein